MSAGFWGRAALALYPSAWRARYGDEVRALIDDAGSGPRTVASLAWHAIRTWISPPRHLRDQRASLATVLVAWVVLAGLSAVFFQLAQAQPTLQRDTTHYRVIEAAYWVFDIAIAVSVLAVILGGLRLWLQMLRSARESRRRREVAYLLAPLVVPAVYLAASATIVALVKGPDHAGPIYAFAGGTGTVPAARTISVVQVANGMVGPWWFLALVLAGFAAAGAAAAGPALALRRLRPQGPAVTLAVRSAGLAAVTMCLAGAASVVAVVGLYAWSAPADGYHEAWQVATYLPCVLIAAVVAVTGAGRGLRSV